LSVRSNAGENLAVIGSIVAVLVTPEDPSNLLNAMTEPSTRIVTLTVTEKAYLRAASGNLDTEHPSIRHDLANPPSPQTVHGFLAEALARRRKAGTAPFSVLCCDNLPANGKTLRRALLEFAGLRDRDLARHIENDVSFPSCMVDRIVPATTASDRERIGDLLGVDDAWPVMTEPFSQWVIEDQFPLGRPDWEPFGVTMVKDVAPYEEMKLRLINGSHSAVAYLGLLLGQPTVDRSFALPSVRRFIDGLWAEAAPTLPDIGGLDPESYIVEIARRYSNTALTHQVRQIATDGSQKLPQRIVVPAVMRIRSNAAADHLSLVVAAWIACCAERGKSLPSNYFTDPLDQPLAQIFARHCLSERTVPAVFDLAGFAHGCNEKAALISLVTGHLLTLRDKAAASALAALEGRAS
jgi:fructuronate reductase